MGDDTVDELVDVMLLAAEGSTAEQLAAALHEIATSTTEVCAAFNRHVDRELRRKLASRGLRPVPLTKLMTKDRFGTN